MKRALALLMITLLLLCTACVNQLKQRPDKPGDTDITPKPPVSQPDTDPTKPNTPDDPVHDPVPPTPTDPTDPADPTIPGEGNEITTPTDPSGTDEPTERTTPTDPPGTDDPTTPTTPTDPEPQVPTVPEALDLSSFDTQNRSIVYASVGFSLLSPDGKPAFDVAADSALISLGSIDQYTVILYCGEKYLAPAAHLTAVRPSSYTATESEKGGIYYQGNGKIVVIDAGHQDRAMTGKEPLGPGSSETKMMLASGTEGVYTKIPEYKLNLSVSLYLRDELISRGYTVVMIRESSDVRISNSQRALIANAYKADAFIRVHANSVDSDKVRGAICIYQTKANPWCGGLYSQSKLLSECVLEEYCSASGIKKGSNWETDTMVGINWTKVPATIVEMGYMSNKDEDILMSQDSFRRSAALGIANGIDRFFEKSK